MNLLKIYFNARLWHKRIWDVGIKITDMDIVIYIKFDIILFFYFIFYYILIKERKFFIKRKKIKKKVNKKIKKIFIYKKGLKSPINKKCRITPRHKRRPVGLFGKKDRDSFTSSAFLPKKRPGLCTQSPGS